MLFVIQKEPKEQNPITQNKPAETHNIILYEKKD